MSRIIRYDYTDPFYAKMAREAVDVWKSSSLYKPHYYPAGYVLCSETQRDEFRDEARGVLRTQNQPYSDFRNNKELHEIMPTLPPQPHHPVHHPSRATLERHCSPTRAGREGVWVLVDFCSVGNFRLNQNPSTRATADPKIV